MPVDLTIDHIGNIMYTNPTVETFNIPCSYELSNSNHESVKLKNDTEYSLSKLQNIFGTLNNLKFRDNMIKSSDNIATASISLYLSDENKVDSLDS